MQDIIQQLASELNKDPRHVENVVRLLDEGTLRGPGTFYLTGSKRKSTAGNSVRNHMNRRTGR